MEEGRVLFCENVAVKTLQMIVGNRLNEAFCRSLYQNRTKPEEPLMESGHAARYKRRKNLLCVHLNSSFCLAFLCKQLKCSFKINYSNEDATN